MPNPGLNVACCAALTVLSACASSPPQAPVDLTALYEQSIHAAAVRDPSFAADLQTIQPGQTSVTVGTFTEWGAPASPTQRPIWVSLPSQLQALCHGKPNAVLAIQQALGLPPQAMPSKPEHEWQVLTFNVGREALFRPCPGGTDIAAPRCGNAVAQGLDEATVRFLLTQLWSSDRIGFRAASGAPDWGYPFTGMGWAYNWDPQAASPIGVSEFVVRKGSVISQVSGSAPAQFCQSGDKA